MFVMIPFIVLARLQKPKSLTRPLLSMARPVLPAPNCVDYVWQSNRSLLFWIGSRYSIDVRSVSKIDIPSGQQDSLEAFNRHVPQRGPRGAYRMTLSPDGKKAQWFEGGPGSPARQWRVVSLDGTSDIVGKWDGYGVKHTAEGAWMPDSNRWIALIKTCDKPAILLYNLATPDSPQEILLPPFRAQVEKASYCETTLIGVTPRGEAVTTLSEGEGISNGEIYRFSLKGTAGAVHRSTVRFPKGARADEVVLSPAGDRLAWRLVYVEGQDQLSTMRAKDELWASRLDGSSMHCIGQSDWFYHPKKDFPHAVHWLPDGKHLSFLYLDELYTVPAD